MDELGGKLLVQGLAVCGISVTGETRGECNCDTGLCECKIAPKSGKKFFGGACQCDPDVCFDPEHPTVRACAHVATVCYPRLNVPIH